MSDRRFIDELIRVSNQYRVLHQVEPLKYNSVISAISQRWAERLAQTGNMQHNPDRNFNGQPLGENIAMKWSSDDQDYTGKEATDQWYNEIAQYNFKRHAGPGTGHFTQLVWKGSREIGVGRAQSRDKKWFVVANYFPPGNYVGENASNVFPAVADGGATASSVSTIKSSTSSLLGMFPSRSQSKASAAVAVAAVQSKPSATPMSAAPAPPSMMILTLPSRQTSQTGVTIEKKQETRTKNGTKTTTVVETFRDSDGRVKTVTTETVEPSRGQGAAACEVQTGLVRGLREMLSSPSTDRDMFNDQVVRQHNFYRRQHGNVGYLTLNPDLCKMAESWAANLACIGRLKLSNAKHTKTKQPLGENITYKYSSLRQDYTGEDVVSQWYSEVKQFNFLNPDACAQPCGHFTQVVWKGSQEIGVGRAFADQDLKVYVVCYYYPAGNILGRFSENVLPSISKLM